MTNIADTTLFNTWTAVPIGYSTVRFTSATNDAVDFSVWQARGMDCHLGEADITGINAVNSWVNQQITYVNDPNNVWQKPSETLEIGTGDCEDYAVLKRAILLERGFNDNELIVVVGNDIIQSVVHALLLVYCDHKWVVLDNRTDVVSDAATYSDFIPIQAYNTVQTWTFGHRIK
jgi:predicted transglutaminase-like cysteine proteinase